MEKYFNINTKTASIRCKLYFGEGRQFERVIIAPHGFGGHKDNRAVERFAEKVLSKHKCVAVVTYDLPCHGDDVRKLLNLNDCDMYMSAVIEHCRSVLGARQLYCYATSFGGYLTLKYISEHDKPFEKTVLRCPAVNMHELLWNSILRGTQQEELSKGKSVMVGFDRKVPIDSAFMAALKENDITKRDFLEQSESLLIIQGDSDEIVSPESVYKFADDNLIELVTVAKADHRFLDPVLMAEAVKITLNFFAL